MDDLIYIIALVAWVVYALYRKSQKKEAAAREIGRKAQESRQPQGYPTLEDILLGREPRQEPEPEPEAHTTATITDGIPPVLKQTAFEMEYNLRGISSIEEMDKPMTLKDVKKEAMEQEAAFQEDAVTTDWRERINLRQAVIYAEILNRPYA